MVDLAVVNRNRALAVFADSSVAVEDDRFLFFGISAAVIDGIDSGLYEELLVKLFSPLEVVSSI